MPRQKGHVITPQRRAWLDRCPIHVLGLEWAQRRPGGYNPNAYPPEPVFKTLAELIGVSEKTLSTWKTGEIRNPHVNHILSLAEILGTTAARLIRQMDEWREQDPDAQPKAVA